MTLKLKGFQNDRDVLVDPSVFGGANVVLSNIDCQPSVYVGAAVIMFDTGSGFVAKNALADSLVNSNVIGIVESKLALEKCNIRVLGVTGTIFTGLDVTKEYYLSNTIAGSLTTTIPTTSGHVVLKLGQPFSDTELLVIKGQRTVRL